MRFDQPVRELLPFNLTGRTYCPGCFAEVEFDLLVVGGGSVSRTVFCPRCSKPLRFSAYVAFDPTPETCRELHVAGSMGDGLKEVPVDTLVVLSISNAKI